MRSGPTLDSQNFGCETWILDQSRKTVKLITTGWNESSVMDRVIVLCNHPTRLSGGAHTLGGTGYGRRVDTFGWNGNTNQVSGYTHT